MKLTQSFWNKRNNEWVQDVWFSKNVVAKITECYIFRYTIQSSSPF